MRWTVHGERNLYDSEWVRLTLVDVEIPGQAGGPCGTGVRPHRP